MQSKEIEVTVQRYHALMNQSNDAIFIISPKIEIYLEVNQQAADLLGYTVEELLHLPPMQAVADTDVQNAQEKIDTLFKGQPLPIYERLFRRKDGTTVPVEVNSALIHDSEGNPIHILSIARDITNRKRAEDALRESEAKYSMLVEQAQDAVFIVQDNIVQFVNQALREITGYTLNELVGMPFINLIAPESRELVVQRYQVRLAGKPVPSVFVTPFLCKDGTIKLTEASVGLIQYQGKPAIMGYLRDITERKRIEEALHESEAKYSALVEQAQDGIYIVQDEIIQFGNQALVKMTGYPINELEGKSGLIPLTPESREQVKQRQQARLAGDQIPSNYEVQIRCKDGTIKTVEITSGLIQYQGKQASMGFVHDITHRKEADSQLKQNEERYRFLFQHATNSLSITDMQGYLLDVNNKFLELIEFDHKPPNIAIIFSDTYAWNKFQNALKDSGQVIDWQLQIITATGKLKDILVSAKIHRLGKRDVIYATAFDITDRLKLDADLVNQKKLAAVGQLAAGVAHELNTPLNNINILAELLIDSIETATEVANKVDYINDLHSLQTEVKVCSNIVNSLLQYSKHWFINLVKVPLLSAIQRILDSPTFLVHLDEHNIHIYNLVKADVMISADPDLLQQVISNILRNAFDAVTDTPFPEITITASKSNACTALMIEDNGIGIPAEDLPKVFDPFFSTKHIGVGTGLGLSIAHAIIEHHRGSIKLTSTVGQGTRVKITLP